MRLTETLDFIAVRSYNEFEGASIITHLFQRLYQKLVSTAGLLHQDFLKMKLMITETMLVLVLSDG